MRIAAFVIAACMTTGALQAQEFDLVRAGLPRYAAIHIRSILDDPETKRITGNADVIASDVHAGNVVVTDGVLTVAGTIRGELIALRGDVVFVEGAIVEGDVTVVDGEIRNQEAARLTGTVTVYSEGFDLVERAERFHDSPNWRRERLWRYGDNGGADLRVHVGENYNRVEGLPVQFGPEIQTAGRNPLRVQALAIWRTDIGPLTETRHMGYLLRAEQFFAGGAVRVGGSVRSTVDPIESWSVTNLEASLATALFHEDQRDYFERTGWSAYLRVAPKRAPFEATVEYRDEEHNSIATRDPWTLFNDDRIWRNQPLIGEGELRTVRGALELDYRNGEEFGTRGWLARAEVTRGIEGSLRVPVTSLSGSAEPIDFSANFTTGLVDLRRYQQVGRNGILAARVVGGGALTERALPPQYQHALGGAGSLPGYSLFSADCGARGAIVRHAADANATFFPSYGCDRMALFQVEYRGGFGFEVGHSHDEDHDHEWSFDTDVDWTLFFDAGRGWALEQNRLLGRSDTRNLYDAGAGIILGGLGIYGAVPIDSDDRGIRVFVRLGPRF